MRVGALAFVFLAACTPYGQSDTSSSLNAPDASDTSDSSTDAASDCPSIAHGMVLVPESGVACPPGTAEHFLQSSPAVMAGACTCGTCNVTTESTCVGANFTWTWGSSNACSGGTAAFDLTADNACVELFANNTTLNAYDRWSRLPQDGVCTASSVADQTKLTTTAVRACVSQAMAGGCWAPAFDDRVCVPAETLGTACSGTYPATLVVGDGAAIACGACACQRTGGACHVEYHNNATCTSKVFERDANALCTATGQPSMQRIKVYPKGMSCNTTPGAATATLTNSRTLCCTR